MPLLVLIEPSGGCVEPFRCGPPSGLCSAGVRRALNIAISCLALAGALLEFTSPQRYLTRAVSALVTAFKRSRSAVVAFDASSMWSVGHKSMNATALQPASVPLTAAPGAEQRLRSSRWRKFRAGGFELKEVMLGDTAELMARRAHFLYRLDEIETDFPKDVGILRPRDTDSITLVNCSPVHRVDNAARRFIAIATLEEGGDNDCV
jgi:hypothetical protein